LGNGITISLENAKYLLPTYGMYIGLTLSLDLYRHLEKCRKRCH